MFAHRSFYFTCALLFTLVGTSAAQTPSVPKLLVVLVVDQMRADYVERFQDQWTKGLRRLIDEGAWFRQAAYPYFQTNTCVGHATISTGALPETHGIIGNAWHDRASAMLRRCADDESSLIVSYGAPIAGGLGPASLRAPTLSDELRIQGEGATRVVSLSMKPRAAIMLAGQSADVVVWRDDTSLVTSGVYSKQPVSLVKQFISDNPIAQDFGTTWTRAFPVDTYLYDPITEHSRPFEGWDTSLPHDLVGRGESPDSLFYTQWAASPRSDDYLVRMATTFIDALDLGQQSAIDYLGISFSALDHAGHRFGPRSHEVQDVLIRLDETLGHLFDHLDATVGQGGYVVSLSADHGAIPIPEALVNQQIDAGRIPAADIVSAAEQAAAEFLGPGEYVARFEEQDFYFSPGVYDRLAEKPGALDQIADAIESVEGVARVYRADTIRDRRDTGNSVERALARSYYPGRSGDLLIVVRPYWTTSTNAAGHGTSYGYDSRVPILLMGSGILPGRHLAPVTPADIAPTLAYLSRITLAYADGRVLHEALISLQ